MFAANGLLGSAPTLLDKSLAIDSGRPDPTISFTLGGMLGTANGASHEGQDDELPTIQEAFGLPTDLLTLTRQPAVHVPQASNHLLRATTLNGETITLRRRIRSTHNSQHGNLLPSLCNPAGSLLDVPIHRMMENLSLNAAHAPRLEDQFFQAEDDDNSLWVDRYRPQKIAELIGNERVVRDVLEWVGEWSWCVFGRRGKKRGRNDDSVVENTDEFHRPPERMLLLSGPPGLGKTTLAHVVAQTAGYEVMEVNASDARSGQVIDDRIRPALEAGTKVRSKKPLLLVIDEIDGATGAGESSNTFIQKLIQLTLDKPRKKKGAKKGNVHRPILRPIICICNDINASALSKLRQHCRQIRMQRPADIHIVKRIREICELEGLQAESRALTTLVGITQGDFRACLNALQFIKSRNKNVTETMIRRVTHGIKEADTSVLSVLNDLFCPLSRKRVKDLGLTEEGENQYVARLSHEIDASGRDISVAIGCFAHYATLRQHDADFTRYERANTWLTTYDQFSSAMYTDGDFALRQYLPYTLVSFYPLFKERGSRVERNQDDWESAKVAQSNQEVYTSLARGLRIASSRHNGAFRHLTDMRILQLEFAPILNRIISPPIRPINSQVIKADEKELLSRLVSIMAAMELRFVQERAEDGQLTYRLDPPIDVFVTYDGKRAADISVSRYAVRHLVAEELNNLLFKLNNDITEKGKRGKHDFFGNKKSQAEIPSQIEGDIADRPPTDFFGRPIQTSPQISRNGPFPTVVEAAKPFRVSFKFAEGNSAAVRKPVRLSAFI